MRNHVDVTHVSSSIGCPIKKKTKTNGHIHRVDEAGQDRLYYLFPLVVPSERQFIDVDVNWVIGYIAHLYRYKHVQLTGDQHTFQV
jgi:hypothetical protein